MHRALSRRAVCVFFAAFALLGLLTAADYGPTWDERDEMDILRMNLWEYARVLGLDQSAFERRAAAQDPLTISALTPISQSIEQDHGCAVFYPMAWAVMDETLTEAQRSALWHMGCWAVFTLGAFALYAVCRQLGLPRGAALLGPLFLLLSPRFFAQGHFNNKDIALMSLVLCTLWMALKLADRPSVLNGLGFALFGALAANTKVAGLAIWGLCGVYVLARLLMQRRMTGRLWALAGGTLLAFGGLYALLTPALWGDPLGFLRYLVVNALSFQRWSGYVLFRGSVFDTARHALPWYYLPYMIWASTPLWVQLACAVGSAGALYAGIRRLRRRDSSGMALLLLLLLWALPLGMAVLTGTRVYNGWRHFYFVYGPMLALAAWGIWRLWKLAQGRRRRALTALLGLCMALSAVGVATQHPFQQTYYQPLVQLRGTDYNELDYWNVSVRTALLRLAGSHEGELSIEPADLWSDDALQKALFTLPEDVRGRFVYMPEDSGARFVLSNPSYAMFSGFVPAAGSREAVSLSAYGQPIMRIYERAAQEVEHP